jgi:hypothetical protein
MGAKIPSRGSLASLILMRVMYDIFRDFLDWLIVIHDNMLVLATDYDECLQEAG